MKSTINADDEDHSKIFSTSAELTNTQRKIFDLLADGAGHSSDDILANALGKKFASHTLVPTHINRIRGKLAGQLTIFCERGLYRLGNARGVANG